MGMSWCGKRANTQCLELLCDDCGHTILGHMMLPGGSEGCTVHGPAPLAVEHGHEDSTTGNGGVGPSVETEELSLAEEGQDLGSLEEKDQGHIDEACTVFCNAIDPIRPVIWIGHDAFLVRASTEKVSAWCTVKCFHFMDDHDDALEVRVCDCTEEGREAMRVLRVTDGVESMDALLKYMGKCIHCRLVAAVPEGTRHGLGADGDAPANAPLIELESGVSAVCSKAPDGQYVWGTVRSSRSRRGESPWSCDTCESHKKCHHIHALVAHRENKEEEINSAAASPSKRRGKRYIRQPPRVPVPPPGASYKHRERMVIGGSAPWERKPLPASTLAKLQRLPGGGQRLRCLGPRPGLRVFNVQRHAMVTPSPHGTGNIRYSSRITGLCWPSRYRFDPSMPLRSRVKFK